jgi:hypothetical protein
MGLYAVHNGRPPRLLPHALPGPHAPTPTLQFVEQYDEKDTSPNATSQPYAFVADKVERCGLSADVGEVMGRGVGAEGGARWRS